MTQWIVRRDYQLHPLRCNIPRLTTVEICFEFLRINKDIVNNPFEFATHLNDLYYNLPQQNYVFRQELLNLWQALFLAYQDRVNIAPKPDRRPFINSFVTANHTIISGTVERASVQVW